jgi:precorrin-3B C17-methyltransferase
MSPDEQGQRSAARDRQGGCGKIFLVGLGPGDMGQMTSRALAAVAAADVAIGYRTYLRLIAHLLEDKEVIERGMAEEIDRCREAIAFAEAGRVVVLVSSGDVGVFGMAGPLYELLLARGWAPGSGIEVEVVPGITSASACASLVGAPLTHDFCAISLSDMLTPWPVIAARLEAAARADFVTVFYNPKSRRRTDQVREAQRIFLRHRRAETPVAIVHAAYRARQSVDRTTLAHMVERDIGMTSTLIIGNSNSFEQSGVMVTPRGYARKYDIADGRPKPGESPRSSLSSGLDGWRRAILDHAAQHGIADAARALGADHTHVLETLVESATRTPA